MHDQLNNKTNTDEGHSSLSTSLTFVLLALFIVVPSITKGGEPARPLKTIPIEELRTMLKGYPGNWKLDTGRYQGLPEPPREKSIPADADRIQLPALEAGDVALATALHTRRSRRSYTTEPLTASELGFLIWSSQGVTLEAVAETGLSFRTAPSAGGRYPLETYILTLRVDGIPIGVHRYLPKTHELVTVREEDALARRLVSACYQTAFVGDAAAVMVWAAVPERTECPIRCPVGGGR